MASTEFEGLRFFKLKSTFSQVVNTIFNSASCEHFIKCFPPEFREQHYNVLVDSYERLKKSVKRNLDNELLSICQDFDIQKRLNFLDLLVQLEDGTIFFTRSNQIIFPQKQEQHTSSSNDIQSTIEKDKQTKKQLHKKMLQLLKLINEDNSRRQQENEQTRQKLEEARNFIAQKTLQLDQVAQSLKQFEPSDINKAVQLVSNQSYFDDDDDDDDDDEEEDGEDEEDSKDNENNQDKVRNQKEHDDRDVKREGSNKVTTSKGKQSDKMYDSEQEEEEIQE